MESTPFIPANPSVEDCWRGVVLYGRNTASYKFALATALLELNPKSGQLVKPRSFQRRRPPANPRGLAGFVATDPD